MTTDDQAGYLTAETAGWLRRVIEPVTDLAVRRDLTAIAEQCFADGHTSGYDRGYADGRADVTAQTVDAVLAEQGVTPPTACPPDPPGRPEPSPDWPAGGS